MSLTLSAADTKRIIDVLFLLKSPAPTPLPKPVTGGGLDAKLDPIAADPRFKDIGFAVVDFTAGVTTPKVWEEIIERLPSSDKMFWEINVSSQMIGHCESERMAFTYCSNG